jgi:hypothetical protein
MSLARRERRRLRRIEGHICRSDPHLARLLADFGEARTADGSAGQQLGQDADKPARGVPAAIALALGRGARAAFRAVVAPGARERVHRLKPQPLARTPPWQRFT